MARIVQHHDKFFRTLMRRPGAAAALLRERLPADVAALLAPDPPELVEGSFVDEDLAAHHADVLFKARTVAGGEAYIYHGSESGLIFVKGRPGVPRAGRRSSIRHACV